MQAQQGTRLHRTLPTRLLTTLKWGVVCVSALSSAVGLAADGRQIERGSHVQHLSTGLLALPEHHTLRVALVQSFPDARRVPVRIRLVDAKGTELLRERQVVADGHAAIAELARRDVLIHDGPLLVQTQVQLGPVRPQTGDQSCPLTLTVQTVEDDMDDGPVVTCHADPCGIQGPPTSAGVFADCSGRNGSFTQ